MKNDHWASLLHTSILVFFIGLSYSLYGQEEEDPAKAVEQYKEESRQLVSFLKFSLNTLGDPEVSAREKEIIINQSYTKIFRDSEVQIEDDLDESREVVTNKDVQAYLKDVDFFFQHVSFDFEITDITDGMTEDGLLFILVEATRQLNGITVDGDTVNSVQNRFIEVNIDQENRDLKIVSIYTTKLSREEELKNWWNNLSSSWKLLFGSDVMIDDQYYLYDVWEIGDTTVLVRGQEIPDTINIMGYVGKIVQKEEIDLSGTRRLLDLKPLNELTNLKKIDISNTDIWDLFPIRSMTSIEVLNCSGTKISDLEPIKYSRSLKELDISNTPVHSLEVLEHFSSLEKLNLEKTVIDSLPPIRYLVQLRELNCSSTNLERLDSISYLVNLEYLNLSNTMVDDLAPIATLSKIRHLEFNNTRISDLKPLQDLESLETVSFYSTPVASLKPLSGLDQLTRVYCDNTQVSKEEFLAFYKQRPDVKVVFSSEQLQTYFNELNDSWKAIISKAARIDIDPEREDLHEILKIKAIDISGNTSISSLEPLSMLIDLRHLDFSHTNISDISPISQQLALEFIDGSASQVVDISPLAKLTNLRMVRFNDTGVSDIEVLANCRSLDSLYFERSQVRDISVLNKMSAFHAAYFDGSKVEDEQFEELNYHQDSAVVVYRTGYLEVWWGDMDDAWQDLLRKKLELEKRPSRERLHKLAGRKSLELEGLGLDHLRPITAFVRLEELAFRDTRVSDLSPLAELRHLAVLRCPRNPIGSLQPIRNMQTLRVLEVQDTQIDDLEPIAGLTQLEKLNCSGTSVKNLKDLDRLRSLKEIDFSNTNVRNPSPLMALSQLRLITCYNNRISSKRVEELKRRFPEADIVFY